MKKYILLLAITLFFITNINAQNIDTYQWKKHLGNDALTYYQKVDSVEQFFSQHDSLKEIRKYGYKDFLRWSFYWENRLDANGKTINLPKMLDSILANGNAFNNKVNTSSISTEEWTPLGLTKKPFNYLGDINTRDGVGMVYTIEVNPLNSNIVLAGTPNGGIWRTDNAGLSWRPIKLIEDASSRDLGVIGVLGIKIDPFDTSRIFIATGSRELETGYTHKYSYGVLLSQNSGSTWQRTGLTSHILNDENINAIAIVGNTSLSNVKVFAVGKNKIYVSNDGASTFQEFNGFNVFNKDCNFINIEVLPDNDQIIVACGSTLFISYDGGLNWNNKTSSLANYTTRNQFKNGDFNNSFNSWQNTTDWNIVNYSGNNVCEIKFEQGKFEYEINHRNAGVISNINTSVSYTVLIPLNCSLVVTYYNNQQIVDSKTYLHTSNNPLVINEFVSNNSDFINKIEYKFVLTSNFQSNILPWIDDSKVICGIQPNISLIIDANNSSSDKISVITKNIDLKDYYFEETNVEDFTSYDGRVVAKVSRDDFFFSLASSKTNSNVKYFGGVNLYKSANLNLNFGRAGSYSEHGDIRDIKIVSDNQNNEIIYVAHDGGVAVSYNNGLSYIDRSNGLGIANFYNLTVSENDPNLIVGGVHDNSTFVLNHGDWYLTNEGDGFGQSLIIEGKYEREGFTYLTNENYQIDRSTFINGVFNQNLQCSGFIGMARFIDKVIVNNQPIIYAINRSSNIIQKSTNKGANWTSITISSIPNTEMYSNMEMSDDNMIWVLTTWSGTEHSIYVSVDAGITFTERTFPTSAQITDIEINKNGSIYDIWVSIGGFDMSGKRVFYTNSSITSWTELGGNTLGEYPVNTLAYDNINSMLFAGTDRGVYYFDNSNNTWYEYNTNLPKCIITKLVISYSNNKLRAATFGRGVWETKLKECVYYTATPEYIEGTITYSTETRATKDIVILPGATLVITGKLFMPNNSSITVKKGGKLVVDGGVITNYCGGMWKGVVVEGTALMGQTTVDHGWCEVKNEGTIENARIAIKSNDGGVVRIIDGNFINNRFGVFFGKYSLAKNQIHSNYSVIANSDFKCYRAMIDKSYVDGGKYEGSKYFVGIAQQSGVRIINNNFESTYHPRADLKGNGIVTWGSRTYIHNNDFTGLTYGIEAAGFQNLLQANSVYGNEFTDVSLAITETAMAGSQLRENTIALPVYESNAWLMENYGMRFDASRSFNVSNNVIRVPSTMNNTNTYGVLVKNSGTSVPCNIEHNSFRRLDFANQLEGDNRVITIQCNQYNQSKSQDWSINPITSGTIHQFGINDPSEMQAANFFPDNEGGSGIKNIRLNENMAFIYYSVAAPDSAIPLDVTENVSVFPVDGSIYEEECEIPFDPCGGNPIPCVAYAQELVSSKEAIGDLNMKYKLNLAQQLLDSGMIEELRVLIEAETTSDWEELKLPIYIEYGESMNINPQDLIDNLPSGEYKDFMQLIFDINEEGISIDSILGENGPGGDFIQIAEGSSEISAAAKKVLEIFYGYQYVREAERWEETNLVRNNTGTIKASSNQEENGDDNIQTENESLKQIIKPDFLLIPNPSDGDFVVRLLSSTNGEVSIIDMHGKRIAEVDVTKEGELSITRGTLVPGVYTIRLINSVESYQLNKRIIILE